MTKSWALYYRNQIATAHKLLIKYEPKAIINALKDNRAAKIYSLRAPHLIPIIEEKQTLLQKENTTLSLEIQRNSNKTYRQNQTGKNLRSKLEDIDKIESELKIGRAHV